MLEPVRGVDGTESQVESIVSAASSSPVAPPASPAPPAPAGELATAFSGGSSGDPQFTGRVLALTQLLPDIVSVLDASGTLLFNSRAAKRIHGYEEEDLVGRSTGDCWHPDDVEPMQRMWARLVANPGSVETIQYRYRNKDGSFTWMEATSSNQLHHPDIRGIVALSRDISARKQEEELRRKLDLRLQQVQNLESLGVLAGGIAHDFNNLLMVVLGNLDFACAQLPPGSPLLDGLGQASHASRRAAELAKQMLAFAGKARFALERLDLRELVGGMIPMLEASIACRASLRLEAAPSLPAIDADPAHLNQAILNLVLNAAEALAPVGGTITLTLREARIDEDESASTWFPGPLPAGRHVLLEVSDTGCGMEPDTLPRVFDPFFSTKFTGRGLGLAAVLGIVRSHGGAVRILSEPGQGTTVGLLFPAAAPLVAPTAIPVPASPTAGPGTVLLVEDEPGVRFVTRRLLEHLGYPVREAADGAQALAILRGTPPADSPGEIGLVVLDLTMPVMDGHEACVRLRRTHPTLPVIVASGHAESEVRDRFAGIAGVSFLQKPFVMKQLQTAVERALAQASEIPGVESR